MKKENENYDCMSIKDLIAQMNNEPGAWVLIDVRDSEEYLAGHIPSAIHLPLSGISEAQEMFSSDLRFVTVCGKGGGRSAAAADALRALGFHRVQWLCGGTAAGSDLYDKASGDGLSPLLR